MDETEGDWLEPKRRCEQQSGPSPYRVGRAAVKRYRQKLKADKTRDDLGVGQQLVESLWFHPERKTPGRSDKVVIASTLAEFHSFYGRYLTPEKGGLILGFDAEWVDPVNYQKGVKQQPRHYPRLDKLRGPLKETAQKGLLSLVQLSTCKGVTILCRLAMWPHLPTDFVSILQSRDVVKIGVGIAEDAKKIFDSYNVKTRSIVDLRFAMIGHPNFYNCRHYNLKAIGQRLFNVNWNLWMQRSNWNSPVLTKSQIDYAALDAQVAVDAFLHVMPISLGFWTKEALIVDSPPPQPPSFRSSLYVQSYLKTAVVDITARPPAVEFMCDGPQGAEDLSFFYIDSSLDDDFEPSGELEVVEPKRKAFNPQMESVCYCRYQVTSDDPLMDFRKSGKILAAITKRVVDTSKEKSFVQKNFTLSADDLENRKVSLRALGGKNDGKRGQKKKKVEDDSSTDESESESDMDDGGFPVARLSAPYTSAMSTISPKAEEVPAAPLQPDQTEWDGGCWPQEFGMPAEQPSAIEAQLSFAPIQPIPAPRLNFQSPIFVPGQPFLPPSYAFTMAPQMYFPPQQPQYFHVVPLSHHQPQGNTHCGQEWMLPK